MVHTHGNCPNIDYCTIADERRMVSADAAGAGFICPECAKTLRAPVTAPGVLMPALVVIGTLVAGASGVYAGLSHFDRAYAAILGTSPKRVVAASVRPRVAMATAVSYQPAALPPAYHAVVTAQPAPLSAAAR